jgi:hypothetical protein
MMSACSTYFGARAGVGFTTFDGDDVAVAEAIPGYAVGGFMRSFLGNLEFETEILLSSKGAKITRHEYYSLAGQAHTVTYEETDNLLYLEVPVLIKMVFGSGYAVAGPSFSLYMDGAYDYSFEDTVGGVVTASGSGSGDADGAESMVIGLVIGGGARFQFSSLDMRVSLGLTSVDQQRDVKNIAYSVNYGYYF